MPGSELFAVTRVVMFGLTGLACLIYAGLALATGNPVPMPAWIPGGLGALSALILWITGSAIGDTASAQAMDEGYDADVTRAQQIGFWVAILLYPIFSVFLMMGFVDWPVAFAAMGTLTGATFLLLFVLFDLRGRLSP